MQLLIVFNNNVVLARDDAGREVVLTGRGLGFQARPGQPIDPERVVRTFVPAQGQGAEPLARLLADIPPENVALVTRALEETGLESLLAGSPATVVAIADHLGFAMQRVRDGVVVEYPLLAEVRGLYADEYAKAVALLGAIRRLGDVALPDSEAVAITLHLVGASFAGGDIASTYTMTTLISQVLEVVEREAGIELDHSSTNVGRFVTHLRYLVVRIHEHKQLERQLSELGSSILESFPRASTTARRLAMVLELRLGTALTDDEIAYLTLHIARLTQAPARSDAAG